jgi:hypothetical protein
MLSILTIIILAAGVFADAFASPLLANGPVTSQCAPHENALLVSAINGAHLAVELTIKAEHGTGSLGMLTREDIDSLRRRFFGKVNGAQKQHIKSEYTSIVSNEMLGLGGADKVQTYILQCMPAGTLYNGIAPQQQRDSATIATPT